MEAFPFHPMYPLASKKNNTHTHHMQQIYKNKWKNTIVQSIIFLLKKNMRHFKLDQLV